jgi:hypothetical protein
MAKFSSPTFGTISGRHGTAVAATTKDGQSILRIYRAPSNPNTPKQQAQRTKFGMATSELSNYKSLFQKTFMNQKGRLQAVSSAMANCMVGEYPTFSIDYSKLQIAYGIIDIAAQVSIIKTTGSNVKIEWDTTVIGSETKQNDNVNFVFINTNSSVAILLENHAIRSVGNSTIELPEVWSGNEIHCWFYFSNPNGNATSNSQYIDLLSL